MTVGILNALHAKAESEWHPFLAVFSRSKEADAAQLEPLSVFLGAGVVPRSARDDNHNELGSDLTKYLRVRPGDLVFNKLRTWQGGFGTSHYNGIVSPAYFVCRPTGLAETRYVDYLLHSSPYLSELTRLSKWMPPSQFDLAWEDLRRLPLLLPPIDVQRQTVSYLDAETARIAEALTLFEAQIADLEELSGLATDRCLLARGWHAPATLEAEALHPLPHGWKATRLSQVLHQLTNGYVGPTRDILVDDGIRYIQSTHIKAGEIDFERRRFYVTPEWHAERPRIHLRAGDVLVVQTGDIGKVAVVPPDFGEASCHALQILRVRPEIVSGEFLGAYLGSSFGYHSLLSRATGALHPHLEGGIRSVPVVLPPLEVQAEIVEEVTRIRRSIRQAQTVMREQIALLGERKCSLITAAVTGEFDASAASGRGVL